MTTKYVFSLHRNVRRRPSGGNVVLKDKFKHLLLTLTGKLVQQLTKKVNMESRR